VRSKSAAKAPIYGRICSYLGLACPHKRSFLDLPPLIRRRNYCEAGLIIDCNILLNWELALKRSKHYNTEELISWNKQPPNFNFLNLTPELNPTDAHACHALLLTCREVYVEVSSILYSKNRLIVTGGIPRGLEAIQALSKTSLASMTELVVYLNPPDWSYNQSGCQFQTRAHQSLIHDWQRTAQHIMRYITPFEPHIAFVCNINKNCDAAEAIIQPFFQFPPLLSCNIRLSQFVDIRLGSLARKAIDYTQRSSSVHIPFRFFDLPYEIRRMVLECTDLLAPNNHVWWSPKGFHYSHNLNSSCPHHYPALAPDHYDTIYYQSQLSSGSCFRPNHHSTSQNFCGCWKAPTALFLVCKALRNEALPVFFGRNRFVVKVMSSGDPSMGSELYYFLTNVVPPTARHYIRSLPLELQPKSVEKFQFEDWTAAVDCLVDMVDLKRLTLCVSVADHTLENLPSVALLSFIEWDKHTNLVQYYKKIIQPLSKLRGIGRFFVYMDRVRRWDYVGSEDRYPFMVLEPSQIKNWEEGLEQLVMGSNYNSTMSGKKVEDYGRLHWEAYGV
jgi:hypothetical protein